eukprot:139940-Pleurochrysis_carterae.AAC.1
MASEGLSDAQAGLDAVGLVKSSNWIHWKRAQKSFEERQKAYDAALDQSKAATAMKDKLVAAATQCKRHADKAAEKMAHLVKLAAVSMPAGGVPESGLAISTAATAAARGVPEFGSA